MMPRPENIERELQNESIQSVRPPAGQPNRAGSDSAAFLRKVYAYMAGGLFATAVTATVVASSDTIMQAFGPSDGPLRPDHRRGA